MFKFKIKVQYKAHGKQYIIECKSKHVDEPFHVCWKDYICDFDGHFPAEKIEVDIKNSLKSLIERGYVLTSNDGTSKMEVTSGIYSAKIVEVRDVEITETGEQVKYLPKWKKYIHEPYVIWLR